MKHIREFLTRNPFNYNRREASLHSALKDFGQDMAKQEFKEECDINTIVRNFGLGYEVPAGIRIPTYGDFTNVEDFHSAANAIAQANESFEQLPAHLRDRWQNDPGRFVDFCSNPSNHDELVKLGIIQEAVTHDQFGNMLPLEMQAPGNAPQALQSAPEAPGATSVPSEPKAAQQNAPQGARKPIR